MCKRNKLENSSSFLACRAQEIIGVSVGVVGRVGGRKKKQEEGRETHDIFKNVAFKNLFGNYGKREKKSCPAGPLPQCLWQLGLGQLKPEVQNTVQIFHMDGKVPSACAITCCLQECVLSGDWNRSRAKIWIYVLWHLNCCTKCQSLLSFLTKLFPQ